MMKPKVLKTEAEYEQALAHIEALMDAEPGTPQEDELELFAVLVENYEQEHFPVDLPDPIEAIKFRMEQQDLSRKDLEPYIGSQSKVSEVLNHKRPLSLAMIRALHEGMGIPAEVLLQEPGAELTTPRYDYRDYPFSMMYSHGYFKSFNGTSQDAKDSAEELLSELFLVFEGHSFERAYCRGAAGEKMNEKALEAWQARAMDLASEQDLPLYVEGSLDEESVRYIVSLSSFVTGPILAREYLQKLGIPLVILEHLPRTYLDGASFKSPKGRPIVGLTLRYDRLDNFWFTLMHELGHIMLHLGKDNFAFFDETETKGGQNISRDPKEKEANDFASRVLLPENAWKRWRRLKGEFISKDDIRDFAAELGISPSIVAGRLRWETGEYKNFNDLLGNRAVRTLFRQD